MQDVPASYLMFLWYDSVNRPRNLESIAVLDYIKRNIHAIEQELEDGHDNE